MVKQNGTASFGSYLNGLLISEICISTDGSVSFLKGKNELARIDENGMTYTHASCTSSRTGSLLIEKNSIINVADTTDEGSVDINTVRLNEETSTFRDFRVFDGKQAAIPLLHVKGKTKEVCVSGTFTVAGKSITIASAESKTLSYTDDEGVETASIGFISSQSTDFSLINAIGNIELSLKNP